ncbi:hypothetical protein MBLNU13_g03416t1 [Cladosporium sp. NU13]
MSYGNSKKWIAPVVREKQRHEKLNQARVKICKDSPFWHHNFDLETHKREFAALQQARLGSSDSSSSTSSGGSPHILPQMGDLPSTPTNHSPTDSFETPHTTPPGSAYTAFSGKFSCETIETSTTFNTNLSPVLCLPTVFTPNYMLGKPFIAPWPSRQEMKYEGDERIATDKLHSRFLGAPRVEGNETVSWQHRQVIEQYPLENYNHIPSSLEVFERNHHFPGLEADNESVEEAWHLISRELYELLDPVDRL